MISTDGMTDREKSENLLVLVLKIKVIFRFQLELFKKSMTYLSLAISGTKVPQIVLKWDKSGAFSHQISVQFGSASQIVLKSDLRKSRICPICGQSDHLWARKSCRCDLRGPAGSRMLGNWQTKAWKPAHEKSYHKPSLLLLAPTNTQPWLSLKLSGCSGPQLA